MTFTTLTFVTFLVVVFGLHWASENRTWRNWIISASSFLFYSYWDVRFALLMLGSITVDYAVAMALDREHRPKWRRGLLCLSLSYNLSVLGFFKYFNFFTENLAGLASQIGVEFHPVTLTVILPVGISFYTFQSLSYTLDVYSGRLKPTRNYLDYTTFVCFFPQLVAGPIERAGHLLGQFQNHRVFDAQIAADGCRLILWGMFKKMVLADNLSSVVDPLYGADLKTASGIDLAVATMFFAFQIYFDFSAYSDIAVGVAKWFGIDLRRNFAYPYFSASAPEFWRRWHISLSTWFRDYVFIPLGGSRCGRGRWAFNLLLTFVISGLWHGASWNFVFWGLLNGLAVLAWTLFTEHQQTSKMSGWKRLANTALTFSIICLTWVFFRAETLPDAIHIFKSVCSDIFKPELYIACFTKGLVPWHVGLHLSGTVFVEWLQRRHLHPLHLPHWPRVLRWTAYTFIVMDILIFGSLHQGSFIYFQF